MFMRCPNLPLLAAAAFALGPLSAIAADLDHDPTPTIVSTVGGPQSSEPCLEGGHPGDPDTALGMCAGVPNGNDFSGRKSILTLIKEDLGRTDGAAANGAFLRVNDADDQIWQVLNGHSAMEVRARTRFQGKDYSFGVVRLANNNLYQAMLNGNSGTVKGKILLESCDHTDLYFQAAPGTDKPRCAEFGKNLAASNFTSIPLSAGERVALAIQDPRAVNDKANQGRAYLGYTYEDDNSAFPRKGIYTSRENMNMGGYNQMVTYRFNKSVRYKDGGPAVTVYVVAFMDHERAQNNTGFNDYVVEITLAEPVAGEK